MNKAYKHYIDDAADSYLYNNDGEVDTINHFLDWLENEYQPNPNGLHGTTPEPTPEEYAQAAE